MKLSLMDEQQIRSFAQANRDLVESVILPDAETIHKEENFFGELFSLAMFLDFSKSLAALLEATVAVTKVISKAEQLFKWMRTKRGAGGNPPTEDISLSERILILAFEAYINRKAGVREDSLRTILDVTPQALTEALKSLKRRGVIRKAKDKTWKYVRYIS